MDYHNADGSLAEMCGNGTRVFAAYLRREGLVDGGAFRIATRGGDQGGDASPASGIAVDLGPWRVVDEDGARSDGFDSTVQSRARRAVPALSARPGQPAHRRHAPEGIDLEPTWTSPSRPPSRRDPTHGTNVEFVRAIGPGHIAMRVHERGVGETRSCGTGAAAAALATRLVGGRGRRQHRVDRGRPGRSRRGPRPPRRSRVELAGPAELVADGTVTLPD